jgi:hypothetical protein
MRMRRVGLSGSTIFSHIISQTARFSKEKDYWIQNVCFDFLYSFCVKYFPFSVTVRSQEHKTRLHLSPICFKWNTLATAHEQGRSAFPSANNYQGQLQTPQSVSIVNLWQKAVAYSWQPGLGQNTAAAYVWPSRRFSCFPFNLFGQVNPTFNYLKVWGPYHAPLWVSSELIARWWGCTWDWTYYEHQRTTGRTVGTLPTPGRCDMTQPKTLIVPYKRPFITALLVDCLWYEMELRLRDGPFM